MWRMCEGEWGSKLIERTTDPHLNISVELSTTEVACDYDATYSDTGLVDRWPHLHQRGPEETRVLSAGLLEMRRPRILRPEQDELHSLFREGYFNPL